MKIRAVTAGGWKDGRHREAARRTRLTGGYSVDGEGV
jgi:hypothetical protein